MPYVDITYARDPATGFVIFDASGYPVQESTGQNTTANTYANLQKRVAYETLGAATTTASPGFQLSDVAQAIQDAIATFEQRTFWFNSIRYFGTQYLRDSSGNIIFDSSGNPIISSAGLMTQLGKEIYSSDDLPALANMPHISNIQVLAFANRYNLVPRTAEWIAEQSVSPTWTGLPTDWATSSGTDIRLYPTPNGAYPLIVDATIRFAPLVNDSDISPWTNRGEPLIRYEAKRKLFQDISRDMALAQAMEAEIYGSPGTGRQGILSRLQGEGQRRQAGPGKLRASRGWF